MAGGRIDIAVEPDVSDFPGKLRRGLSGVAGVAGTVGKGIGLAIAAGTAVAGFGLKSIIETGNDYTDNLNEMQAVTQATAVQMQQVGRVAKALGADMTLPATSAADAAAAMVELAKGGLTVDQAMKAAKGTLQLAAAAQIDGAQAAEIQSSSLNAFRLNADQAGRVADVLANTANAAAGSIVDIGNSMKFVAPVSAALGVSIEDTAAAIGLLANQGVKGEQAGTSLRGILASLASPSKQAKDALDKLGIAAFDAQGKFIGLRAFTDQLAKAKGRLTQADFVAAASTAFGNEGLTAANALAAEGATNFDSMAKQVGRAGGAADVAAARTKGLRGAIEGLKSQAETAGIGIYEAIAPKLEAVTRAAAGFVERFTPTIVSGIQTAVSAGEVFGPRLADAIRARGDVVGKAIHDVIGPIASTIPGLLNAGLNTAIDLWTDLTRVLGNVVRAAEPVAHGIASVARAAVDSDGPLSTFLAGLRLIGSVVGGLSSVLVPIGHLVGGLAGAFASLPGPIQSAVIALAVMSASRDRLSSLGDTVRDRVTGPFKRLGEEIQLQQGLMRLATGDMDASLGRVSGAMAVLESRVPVIGRMAEAYRAMATSVTEAGQAHAATIASIGSFTGETTRMRTVVESAVGGVGRLAGAVAGVGAAGAVAVRSGISGLTAALGGPWGIAIAAATLGLSLLAGRQQEAAKRAAEHQSRIQSLTDAFVANGGAIDENVRRTQVKAGEDAHLFDIANRLGVSQETMTKALLGNRDAIDEVNAAFDRFGIGADQTNDVFAKFLGQFEGLAGKNGLGEVALAATTARREFGNLTGGLTEARDNAARLEDAIRKGDVSMLEATGTGRDLAKAMATLRDNTASADDRARALKQALDALNGGQVDLEAAQARLNEQLARLSDLFGKNLDKAKGWGAALLNADGSINTTTENGRNLFNTLNDISGSMAEVAQRTFDAARQQGDSLPDALAKAQAAAQSTRDSFVANADAMGLTADQAAALADHYGLIPSVVATAIETPGMSQAQQELILVRNLVNQIPGDKPITVRSLSDEAKQKLLDLGFTVRTLPDGSVTVAAKTDDARARLNELFNNQNNRTLSWNVKVASGTGHFMPGGLAQGGILKFARGGMYGERHHPMVAKARPGMVRVWAEPETVAESYIPWARDRRARATKILDITASAFGFTLVPKQAADASLASIRRFALGGIASVNPVSTANSQAPRSVTVNMPVTVQDDRSAAEFAKITSAQVAWQTRFA